jgi:tetraacyldisaccharide 4'-kinase
VIVEALSAVYGAAATWRRRWYTRGQRQHYLSAPVVSVGNLRVGGTGKTPTVECLARLLVAHGERPAILTRGYGREQPSTRVTVVSTPERVVAEVAQSGDEAQLLARKLPGVPVLVCTDRHRAGVYAEREFASTVHLLDDGFQHLRLARDVDLLLVDEDDLGDRVLPAGRLREPIANAAAADAVIVTAASQEIARTVANRLGVSRAFCLERRPGEPRLSGEERALVRCDARLFAVAGIARPERFFSQLEQAGFQVVGTRAFKDHHPFDATDVMRIAESARATAADLVVTTEKDAVRLESQPIPGMPLAVVPLEVRIEPADLLASWLLERLRAARQSRVAVP